MTVILECTKNRKKNKSTVFVELITYIEKAVESGTLLFRLADLYFLYVNRLGDLDIIKTVNKIRLKGDLPLFISSQLQELPPLMTMQRMFLSLTLKWNCREP